MAIIVIGAQVSGVGKTGLICSLIAVMPERRWTAIKITQCGHEDKGKVCDCQLRGGTVAISDESDASATTDTSRFLAAGAERAIWVRTLPGYLAEAMPRIREEIARAQDVILESNSVLEFLDPDLYALIVSPCVRDFKPSARRYLDRVDVILMAVPPAGHKVIPPAWVEELHGALSRIPQFAIAQPQLASPEFVVFVRSRLDAAS